MIEPSLALQRAIRARLVGTPAFTALVPADNVLDRSARPERFPTVLIGAGLVKYRDDYDTFFDESWADFHVWVEEEGLTGAKAITGAIRDALATPITVEGHRLVSLSLDSARFIRDPDGRYSHAILSVHARLQRLAA